MMLLRLSKVILGLVLVLGTSVARAEPIVVFPLVVAELSSGFGVRHHPVDGVVRHHDGVDLRADMGTDVRAMFEGVVIFAGDYAGYGNLVVVKHKKMLTTHYAHLSSIGVGVGVRVKGGQKVGTVGETGTATGPHLHLEIRRGGEAQDPLKLLPSLLEVGQG